MSDKININDPNAWRNLDWDEPIVPEVLKKTDGDIARARANRLKAEDPKFRDKIRQTVKDQWKSEDQSKRLKNVSGGVAKKWEDPEYSEKVRKGRAESGQYTDPSKAANFQSPIIGTDKKTGIETIYYGAKELKNAGFEPANVYYCINGQRKSAGGCTWRRKL
jgi:hypothetical protein